MSLQDLLNTNPVIPVVVVNSADEGIHVGESLLRGGISTAEVTFRTVAAESAIREMKTIEGLHVGAGTVINAQQAETAINAGATFIVSPGFSADVVRVCQDANIPVIPACTDGSWIMAALDMGVDVVKFFPASVMGGVKAIKALAAPFPSVGFVPTGGVSAANLAEYLSVPAVRACGGSWMVKPDLVREGQWDTIATLSAEAISIAKEAGR